jgi:WD40 repeat protein
MKNSSTKDTKGHEGRQKKERIRKAERPPLSGPCFSFFSFLWSFVFLRVPSCPSWMICFCLILFATGSALGQPPAHSDDDVLRLLLRLAPVPLRQERPIDSLVFSGDGKTVTTVSNLDAEVFTWNALTGALRKRVRLPLRSLNHSALSGDGSRLAVVDFATKVSVWNTATGRKLRQMDRASGICLAFSANGKIIVAGTAEGRLGIWDASTGKRRCALPGSAGTRGTKIAISPDGKLVAATLPDGSIGLWNATTGKEFHSIRAGMNRCRLLSFTPDSGQLAACDATGQMRFWDAAIAKERRGFQIPPGHRVTAGRFSADGRTLLTAGSDGTVRVWELATGEERRLFVSNEAGIRGLALSDDGQALVAAGDDQLALVRTLGPPLPLQARIGAAPKLEALWADLAGGDARIAYQAVAALAARPAEAVPFLKERLHPAVGPDPKLVARLLKELDSPFFSRREKATRELQQFGPAVEADLEDILRDAPSPEVSKRAAALLAKLRRPSQIAQRRRTLRAIEVLELAGTRSARQVLRLLANGAPGHEVTRHAEASLRRLAYRPIPRP